MCYFGFVMSLVVWDGEKRMKIVILNDLRMESVSASSGIWQWFVRRECDLMGLVSVKGMV